MRTQSMRDGDLIFSQGKRFAFGFFSLGVSKLRYVGIWYAQISEQTVVWVANRDRPMNDTSGVIRFSSGGNLCIYGSVNRREPLWSTNVSDRQGFWESFDHPTDTALPFMRLGFTRKDGLDHRVLTSWKTPGDPSSGTFTYRIKRMGQGRLNRGDKGCDRPGPKSVSPRILILYKGLVPWWRTGTWTGLRWSGVPEMTRGYIFNSSFVNTQDEVSIAYGVTDASVITRMMVNETGNMQRFTWLERDKRWNEFWSVPKEECDYYAHCSLNGYCDPTSSESFECTCLPGFEPNKPRAWFLRDTSGGCTKKNRASLCREKEGFVKLMRVKISVTSGATVDMNITLKECERRCLRNCSCVAYANAYHESSLDFKDSFRLEEDQRGEWELPLFELNTIATATNNFAFRNKLGSGGFGPVYKGVLENGMEIAVKRVVQDEVKLISKLQHRNLMRILGYCVESDEKMLVYEYLPNKSLDCFIFHEEQRAELDWPKRMEIIRGITRGILYLHQDSRLRIIHRDLKASNVLLDSEMIPKIADFGMARIFGGSQIRGSTSRVVGTYGYMSPEYAMEGHFSIKSDVYSFGVLILEIITGKRNSAFHEESSNLVGHIWDVWNKGEAVQVIDKLMNQETIEESEVNIGLLCVQENASDRPDMSSVVFMFGHNANDIPSPKHPAFTAGRKTHVKNGDCTSGAFPSVNDVTLTDVHGR
ncbi:hypothetical protein N665_0068s0018 [Sinapis alba]|nr:hypothetical protein N665_0068s0018 [Sinapis alba]